MSIEERFDVPLIAGMALREKQLQQHYRPVIGIHKWFARRPGTLFRGLLFSEFRPGPLADQFFQPQDLSGLRIADPFMGGGTPLLEANRAGCEVLGSDINPMSTWIVREALDPIDLDAYRAAARRLVDRLRAAMGSYLLTSCPLYGDAEVPVKAFLTVKVLQCAACAAAFDLFPHYRVAAAGRHPCAVRVCPGCGELCACAPGDNAAACSHCQTAVPVQGPARAGHCPCPYCGHDNPYPVPGASPLPHRLFALEYHNPRMRARHQGRFFKRPDAADLLRHAAAERHWAGTTPRFVPAQEIPRGDETQRLHRWGYTRYRDLFSPRQLLGLELSCRLVAETADVRIQRALATNLSDLLRYQNLLCRYDVGALKAQDVFAVHGFPVGLLQCEPNLLGIPNAQGAPVGSGGWINIVDKYSRAKQYCAHPFEIQRQGRRNVRISMPGEWIGQRPHHNPGPPPLRCASATIEVDLGAKAAV